MADKNLLKGTIEWVYWDIECPRGYVWDATDWLSVQVALLLEGDPPMDSETYSDWLTAEIVTDEQAVRVLADTVAQVTSLGNYRARIKMTPTPASLIAEKPFYKAIGRVVVEAA